MKIIGTMRAVDSTRGAVRVEETYDTDIEDLWDACTKPVRLARWIAEVSGDLHAGGEFAAVFTTGWDGVGRVEECEPPRRLLVSTREADQPDENLIEITLTTDGERTVLVIEERGVSLDQLPGYGAGWQVHAEDLAAHLAGTERCDMKVRWGELNKHYEQIVVS